MLARFEALTRGFSGVAALRGPGGAEMQVPRTLGEALDAVRALSDGAAAPAPGDGSGWVLMSMLQPLEKLQEVVAAALECASCPTPCENPSAPAPAVPGRDRNPKR